MLTQDQVMATVAHLAHKVVVHEEKIAALLRLLDARDEQELKLRDAHESLKMWCDEKLMVIEQLEAWKQRFTQAIPVAPVAAPADTQEGVPYSYPKPVHVVEEGNEPL